MANILELKHITKVYPGVVALDDVSMSFEPGEIHSIMGENGAGKSTLIKIVAGAIESSGGTVVINGKEFEKLTPAQGQRNWGHLPGIQSGALHVRSRKHLPGR